MSDSLAVYSLTIYSPQVLTLVEGGKPVTATFASTFFTHTVQSKNAVTLGNVATTVPVAQNQALNSEESGIKITYAPSSDSSGSSVTTSASASAGTIPSEDQTTASGTATTGTPQKSSNRLPDGAVAGIAIACIVAGLAIGLVAGFIFFRRHRKSTAFKPDFVELQPQHSESKNGPLVNVTSSTHDAELGQFLLDATPDKEIQTELRSLSELIFQHVETYYHEAQVHKISAEMAQCLAHIGYSPELSGLRVETVAAICLDLKTSQDGLRHVLSHIIFRSLDFNSGGSLSMLPPAVAAMAQASHPGENPDSPATSIARSRWRSLSALLLHPNPEERTPLPLSGDEVPSKAHALVNELNRFLHLFVTQESVSQQEQTNHLQAVILECTRLGYVLLSQPGDWRFIFRTKTISMDKTRKIVVCPGLERLSSNDGTSIRPPFSNMPNPLRASYHFLTWILDHDQVPNDIRSSIELVRTCDSDLQHLIELRNDCLPLLERRPKVLQRVHTIIESAQKGLQEVCEIIERCRPENDRGTRTKFSKRMAWIVVESSEFKTQEPIVSRHHAAVLAELNFLRQIALMAPITGAEKREEKRGVVKEAAVFDNVALLGDILGDLTIVPEKKPPVTQAVPSPPSMVIPNANTEPPKQSSMSSLQVPAALHQRSSSQTLHLENTHDLLPEVLPVNMASATPSRSLTAGSKYNNKDLAGLALLLGDPLDFQIYSRSSPASQKDAIKQTSLSSPPSEMSTYGPSQSQSMCIESKQHLPYNPRDIVSELSQSSQNSFRLSSPSRNVTNPLHYRQSALFSSSSITQASSKHCQSYPGQLVWTNPSSTTISVSSPGFHENNYTLSHPIAELDTSPYHMVPLIDAPNQYCSLKDQKLALQVNTTPIELPAEESQAHKPKIRRQIRLGSSRSENVPADPVLLLH
ncbi:hypothetical protein FLONG3_7671 [Fusarium longipes]|uniref:Uncharacterized protein n=1 Tax=Fusarium longipes TaxID=694270 RepID=A0A395SC48_9HYPO|nr:hypothetical protein FLONG3_7671 [Fusarium longipes]